uniref:Protein kinase domain-containing protein n=1 Tax=Panagrolaimus davidi TaxID=227884 RepID=A0A914QF25_9BILA
MSLAGPSLSYLRRHSPQQRMTYSTGLRIALHCLSAIEDLHCIGYLHRDIKASNFAVGYYASEARTIRILDFGFARSYLSWDSTKTYLESRRPRPRAPFLGTDRYCSTNVHKRIEQGRRDDCWSWLFMLVELLYGKLPWRDVSSKKICQVKEDSLPTLFRHGPVELYSALDHLQSLKYESRPNYDHLREIITKICAARGFKFSDPYDWEAGGENYEVFEQLKNNSTTTSTRETRTATSASPNSTSQKFEHFENSQLGESFVEILDREPSPPAEKFVSSKQEKKNQKDDYHFEDAKDSTK